MDRVVGMKPNTAVCSVEAASQFGCGPAKVKIIFFVKPTRVLISIIGYEEPPGNGGFLLNGGRLYLDMGHIEYASPEYFICDLVAYELAGDDLSNRRSALGAEDRVVH
jgi:proteasome accessory factor A